MTITPIGANPAAISASAGSSTQVAAHSDVGKVSVTFSPEAGGAGPLDRIGTSVVEKLKQFEARRSESSSAMSRVQQGPASAVDAAKSSLMGGPASASSFGGAQQSGPATGSTHTDDALSAMTRSFDYAIETQLIVKTGSQLSSSASSLMRGQ